MKVILLNMIRNLLLSVVLIFLAFSLLALVDYFLRGDEATLSAVFGLFMITAIFAIPYFIFFRKKADKSAATFALKSESTLEQIKCNNCNSSQLSEYKQGYRCDHCGSYFQ